MEDTNSIRNVYVTMQKKLPNNIVQKRYVWNKHQYACIFGKLLIVLQ